MSDVAEAAPSAEPGTGPSPNRSLASVKRRPIPRGLWAAAALGLGVRWFTVFVAKPTCVSATDTDCFRIAGDVLIVDQTAELMADGHWFKSGYEWWANGLITESAARPPMFPLFVAAITKLGLGSDTAQRAGVALLGVLSVVLIGLVARRLAGDRAGLIAAFIAAVHPLLWIGDAMMMSEALYVPLIAASLLSAYRYLEKPSTARLVTVAAVVTLAGLVRTEGVLLIGLLVVPLVWRAHRQWQPRLMGAGIAVGVSLVLLAPWVIYNNSRFAEPVTVTSSTGWVLFAGSCDAAWQGEYIGYWAAGCVETRGLTDDFETAFPGHRAGGSDKVIYDESVVDAWYRDRAIEYYQDNATRFPVVAAARMGRTLEVFNAGQGLWLDHRIEGRWQLPATFGLAGYYLLLPFTVAGAMVLRRRGQPVFPLLVLWPLILVTAAMTYGITRYRIPIDVAMVILAAVAVDAGIGRLRQRRSGRATGPVPSVVSS